MDLGRQFTAEFKRRVGTGSHQWPADRPDRPEPHIYGSTLGGWVRQDRIGRGERDGLTSDERARLWEL